MIIMKCERCNVTMKKEEETLFGIKVKVYVCGKCGNQLLPLKEAIKVQQKIIPKIETSRKLVQFGGSIAVTLPKELKPVFRKGERVRVTFDPKEMEIKIKKI